MVDGKQQNEDKAILPAVSICEGLEQLMNFLGKFEDIMLVAHNGRKFDFKVLIEALVSSNLLLKFYDVVAAFLNSLRVFQQKFLSRRCNSLTELVKDFLPNNSNRTHDATEDVRALVDLLQSIKSSPDNMKKLSHLLFALINRINSTEPRNKTLIY